MNIKFTPKPWKIVVYEADIHNFDPSHREERQNVWSLGGKICELYNRRHVGVEKTRANARLIAVSPDMYDLVKKGYGLSKYAAAIHFDGTQNTPEFLATLAHLIEDFQDSANNILYYVDGTGLKP